MEEIQKHIEAVKAGETAAFVHIYDRYIRLAASMLRKVSLCDEDSLEDHLNEVFLNIFRGLFDFRGKSGFTTYVYSIIRNYVCTLARKRKRGVAGERVLEESHGSVCFENRILDTIMLKQALRRLSMKLRVVIVLHYYDGYSVREIAELERISEDAVKNRLMRGRRRLRELLTGGVDESG